MASRTKKEPRVILLSNSLSTWNKKGMPAVRRVVDNHDYVLHLEGNSMARLYRQLESCRGKNPDLVILNGGDGTIHSAITFILNNKLFPKMPPLALIGGGMTNMAAKDLGTGGKAAPVLEKILECYEEGVAKRSLTTRQLVRVDFRGKRATQYGFFFGVGMMVNAIDHCTNNLYSKGIKGKPSQVITMGQMVMSMLMGGAKRKGALAYVPEIVVVPDKGQPWEGRVATVLTTSLKKLIFATRTRQEKGKLPLFMMRPTFGCYIVSLIRGMTGTMENVKKEGVWFSFQERFTIEGGVPFTMDGELFETMDHKSFTVSAAAPLEFVTFLDE